MLLQFNFFKEIIKPIPEALPKQSKKSRTVFWIIFFISASIACITFIPMVDIAKVLFADASNRELTWFFPLRMNYSVMLWAAFNGIIGILIFLFSYETFGKNHGVKKDSWGLKINKMDLIKTFVLSLIIFSTFYLFLYLNYYDHLLRISLSIFE